MEMLSNNRITINKIDDVFIIKKTRDSDSFITTSDSFIISSFTFYSILNLMLRKELISPKVFEGLLSEFYGIKEI